MIYKTILMSLLIVLVLVSPIPTSIVSADAVVNPGIEATWTDPFGPCYAVCVDDNRACIGSGNALVILNISDPSNPVKEGWINTNGTVLDVCIVKNYAYAACYDGGLYVVDISDPTSPVRWESIPLLVQRVESV